ncbi:hypothetical protein ACP4OV_004860 [Aristida adscensionis]
MNPKATLKLSSKSIFMHIEQLINMHKLAELALLVVLLTALGIISPAHAAAAVRMQLSRRTDAGSGLTGRELLQRMALGSLARAAQIFSASPASAPVVPGQRADDDPYTLYLARLAIGTPPQPVLLVLDTGSDLTWTQCLPCPACFAQGLPYFNLSLSSTFAARSCGSPECQSLPVPSCGTKKWWGNNTCVYTYSYGDNSVTTGLLALDTVMFAGDAGRTAAVPGVAFGCGVFNNGLFRYNMTGIAGFGRGALSLPSQLKVDNFSYCFTAMAASTPSPVLLGLPANLYSGAGGAAVQTTPIIQNPTIPTLYYLSMKGITVGSTRLPVPESAFALRNNGTDGGTIIDSGTSILLLPDQVYQVLRDAFVAQVKLPAASVANTTDAGPLCFTVSPQAKPDVPRLVLHFDGATMDLRRENYLFDLEDAGASYTCVAVMASELNMTIIGNFQQQNMHVLYDLANNKLSFVPAQCDKV